VSVTNFWKRFSVLTLCLTRPRQTLRRLSNPEWLLLALMLFVLHAKERHM